MRTLYLMLTILSLAATQQTIPHSGFGYELLLTNLEHLRNEQMNAGEMIAQNITLLMKSLPACPDTTKVDGVYNIRPHLSTLAPFPVYCEYSKTHGDGWIVVQRRFNGNLNFDRTWSQFRNGFGSLQGEFWLGLEKMHQISRSGKFEALIILNGENGKEYDAKYSQFAIGSEFDGYVLKIGKLVKGSVTNELGIHNERKFTTSDVNNANNTCVNTYKSGWWYQNCHNGNLNIPYENGKLETKPVWYDLRNTTEYLTAVRMMIRAVYLN